MAFAIYHSHSIEIRFSKISLENKRYMKIRLNGKEQDNGWFFQHKYSVKLEKYLQQEKFNFVKTLSPLEALLYYLKALKSH